jgi:hypothetical protein
MLLFRHAGIFDFPNNCTVIKKPEKAPGNFVESDSYEQLSINDVTCIFNKVIIY